jgi:hypothetical protein
VISEWSVLITMGSQVQISRLGERFSSHTRAQPRPHHTRSIGDAESVRERLIAATVEVLAVGGDPRLAWARTPS